MLISCAICFSSIFSNIYAFPSLANINFNFRHSEVSEGCLALGKCLILWNIILLPPLVVLIYCVLFFFFPSQVAFSLSAVAVFCHFFTVSQHSPFVSDVLLLLSDREIWEYNSKMFSFLVLDSLGRREKRKRIGQETVICRSWMWKWSTGSYSKQWRGK